MRDIATNESPAAYSLPPRPTIAFSSINSWLLCTVIVHARLMGSCSHEQTEAFDSQVCQIGIMGTSFFPFVVIIAGPV